MKRYRLFSPNMQELPVWKDFADAIDEVFKNGIDDPQQVFRLLRDTFSFGPSSYEPLNDPSLEEVFRVLQTTNTLYMQTINLNYPRQDAVFIYTKDIEAPDSDYTLLSVPQYFVVKNNGVTFQTPIAAGTMVKVVPRPLIPAGAYDINNFYNFSGEIPDGRYQVSRTTFPQVLFGLDYSKPDLVTGYPDRNNLLIFVKTIAQDDVYYQFVPPSQYSFTSSKTVLFNVPIPINRNVKFVVKPISGEITRKLNQLGFDYNDFDVVTLPQERVNSEVTQLLADNLGAYYLHTKGTKSFPQFFSYVFKTIFDVRQLWAQDLGDDAYHNFTQHGSMSIGTPVWDGGNWYPTSHVEIYYDLLKFGNSLDEATVKDFFFYICPINLVVVAIVLETVIEGEVYVGGDLLPIITYL